MSILRVEGKIRELVIFAGFVAFVVLLTSYLITPATGIIGIGYAFIAAHGAASVYALFTMRSSYVKRRI